MMIFTLFQLTIQMKHNSMTFQNIFSKIFQIFFPKFSKYFFQKFSKYFFHKFHNIFSKIFKFFFQKFSNIISKLFKILFNIWLKIPQSIFLITHFLLLAPYSLILNILLLTKPSQFELDSKVLLLVGNKKHSFFLLSACQLKSTFQYSLQTHHHQNTSKVRVLFNSENCQIILPD